MNGGAVRIRTFRVDDTDWVIRTHGDLYARDEGFDRTIEDVVARNLTQYVEARDPTRECGWIAEKNGERAGSIFCFATADPAIVRMRMFLLLPEYRGLGWGRALLGHSMEFARDAGYARYTLWTHESHRAACALYAASGFELVESRPARNFGLDVVEQHWEIDL